MNRLKSWLGAAAAMAVVGWSGVAGAQDAPIESVVARCHGGDYGACAIAGARYQTGTHGAPRDAAMALDLYTRACDANLAIGCSLMAGVYLDGVGVPADPARAATLYRRACDGGYAHACGQLGVLYAGGRGVERDFAVAAPLLERGCSANHWGACGIAGRMYRAGLGVPRNEARGTELLQRGCTNGFAPACNALAEAPPPVVAPGSAFAAPPPVVSADVTFSAPPPVVAAGTYAAPPPVAVAPPPVVVAPPRPVAPVRRTIVAEPESPYTLQTYRQRYRPTPAPSSSPSTVALLGLEIPLPLVTFSYELAVGADAPTYTSYGLGMLYARGPIEFGTTLRFGGGDTLATANAPSQSWSGLLVGGQLGLNLLSAPRADRNSFSPLNLVVGVHGSYALADLGDAPAGRLGAYVANTLFFSCSFGLRAEYTRTFVGDDTFGHTLSLAIGYARRPDSACR